MGYILLNSCPLKIVTYSITIETITNKYFWNKLQRINMAYEKVFNSKAILLSGLKLYITKE